MIFLLSSVLEDLMENKQTTCRTISCCLEELGICICAGQAARWRAWGNRFRQGPGPLSPSEDAAPIAAPIAAPMYTCAILCRGSWHPFLGAYRWQNWNSGLGLTLCTAWATAAFYGMSRLLLGSGWNRKSVQTIDREDDSGIFGLGLKRSQMWRKPWSWWLHVASCGFMLHPNSQIPKLSQVNCSSESQALQLIEDLWNPVDTGCHQRPR